MYQIGKPRSASFTEEIIVKYYENKKNIFETQKPNCLPRIFVI